MATELIIFDLDGTLVDSLADLTEAVNRMRADFALVPLGRGEVRAMVGKGARTLVERALPGKSSAEVDQGLELFLAYNEAHLADHTVAYPGVPEMLALLRTRGMQLVVVSNKNESLCRQLLEKLGLAGYFTAIHGADSFPEQKPSPLPLLTAMGRLQQSAATTIVVGDSENDVLAALGSGIAVIGCHYGYGNSEELAGATFSAGSVREVLELLQAGIGDQCVG